MQTSYGCIFFKKTSVAAINITLGVPGQRADKRVESNRASSCACFVFCARRLVNVMHFSYVNERLIRSLGDSIYG